MGSSGHSRKSKTRKPRKLTRICNRHPLHGVARIAQSRTESVLVSSSGDLLVCRCRRSSTPYFNRNQSTASMDQWAGTIMPCFDTAEVCGIGIDHGSFFGSSPSTDRIPKSKSKRKNKQTDQTSATVVDGHSTYEWEKPRQQQNEMLRQRQLQQFAQQEQQQHQLRPGLLGGAMHNPIGRNVTQQGANNNSNHPGIPSPRLQTRTNERDQDSVDQEEAEQSTEVSYAPKDYLHNEYSSFDGGMMPLPSFDYNGFDNDMVVPLTEQTAQMSVSPRQSAGSSAMQPISEHGLHEEKKDDLLPSSPTLDISPPSFLHGIPTFLSSLSQIRVTKVSAHPLGAHVLMISEEALLFTYGLNHHGQLGIGVKSNIKDFKRGFITEPTIVTPLLENGGKAIQCAAGVDHSLVVVETEGRRLQKLQRNSPSNGAHSEAYLQFQRVTSSPSKLSVVDDDSDEDQAKVNGEELVLHHQLYGFGNNSFMKLGLISAAAEDRDGSDDGSDDGDDSDDVLLPRRVALHCTVWPNTASSANGKTQSSRSSSSPDKGLPQGIFDLAASTEHSAALVRRATGDVEVYVWGNATLGALGVPVNDSGSSSIQFDKRRQMPVSKANNIFPIPTLLESLSYKPRQDAKVEYPTEISLGPYCSFVVLSSGRCKGFGLSVEGMLGHAYGFTHTSKPKEVFLPPEPGEGKRPGIVSISAGAHHVIALTEEGKAYSWGINSNSRLGLGADAKDSGSTVDDGDLGSVEWVPQEIKLRHHSISNFSNGVGTSLPPKIIQASAGYDSSMLILENGQVLSFGKGSGRVGLGEVVQDVSTPCPVYGGLRLFTQRQPKVLPPKPAPLKAHMRRSSAPVKFKGTVQSAVI